MCLNPWKVPESPLHTFQENVLLQNRPPTLQISVTLPEVAAPRLGSGLLLGQLEFGAPHMTFHC